jgi:transcription-repair coupling factor (superfamily II helicase)
MTVRLLLKKTGVSKLDVSNEALTFTFSAESSVDPEKVLSLVERDPSSFQFLSERKLKINIDEKPSLDALLQAIKITEELDQARGI